MKPSSSSEAQQRRLQRLGLVRDADFILHLPLRYEDNTRVHAIGTLSPGQYAQIEGEITGAEIVHRPRRQLLASMHDQTGSIRLRWLHFYPGQLRRLEAGGRVRIRGEVRGGFQGLELVHPRLLSANTALPTTLTPVYPTTDGLAQDSLRKAISEALARVSLDETLPEALIEELGMMPLAQALEILHHPPAGTCSEQLLDRTHPAWQRVKLDELLAQQLSLAAARDARRRQRAWPLDGDTRDLAQRLRAGLPFTLTAAQEKVIAEISQDLRQSWPMHRLLQGDVGSGKTIVAAFAAIQAVGSAAQVAIMAPTEILSEQHYQKLSAWLHPLGITCVWLVGRQGAGERREHLQAIAGGHARVIIGTQALIQDQVQFQRLGLVILDEQHRFGVGQRLALSRKGDDVDAEGARLAHQLNMSATPIPRTLAMSFLADLDVSVIDSLPPGRRHITTRLIKDIRRDEVLSWVNRSLQQGRQAYWVCPLVEESDSLQLQTAIDTHAQLQTQLAGLRVGLVHGRLSYEEKHAVMQAFRAHELDLLVATTVIEVGVDVPNASIMVIEHAERYGLAQLHQLRGRVGRGTVESVCVLMYQAPLSPIASERLRALYETGDGFEIARRDLAQRGPGEFLGVRQSGRELLQFADAQQDQALLEHARSLAIRLRETWPGHARRHQQRWMRGREDYLRS
ncbi:MAG: ATP-dependent DNA helicase RecG [Castellaniella sp.]